MQLQIWLGRFTDNKAPSLCQAAQHSPCKDTLSRGSCWLRIALSTCSRAYQHGLLDPVLTTTFFGMETYFCAWRTQSVGYHSTQIPHLRAADAELLSQLPQEHILGRTLLHHQEVCKFVLDNLPPY